MAYRMESEAHIEVYHYPLVAVAGVTFLALALHGFLPRYLSAASLLELPLLVTVYFGLSRRNPTTGLLLGMTIGLLQDSISGPRIPLGYHGIAKTLVGYIASTVSGRIDVEHPLARALLAWAFFYLHLGALWLIGKLLLGESLAVLSLRELLAALLNGGLAFFVFPLLDRLRLSR